MTAMLDAAATDPWQIIADLQRKLDASTAERDALQRELVYAGERQTATAEVLQVINSSPGDLSPVFDAILGRAMRFAEASFGILMTYDGDAFHTVALRGVPPTYAEFLRSPIQPGPLNGLGRLLSGERLVHIHDITADLAYASGDPLRKATAELGGSRTHLVVPLLKDEAVLGVMVAYRQEVRPFSDKQIALLQNFAAQAVIAMENARLLTETREALEQQTATAEVLQVINSSPGNLAPVFDAMLEKATRLCEATFGQLATYDGKFFRFVAVHGEAPLVQEQQARGLLPPSIGVTWPRIVRGESLVHMADVMDTDLYRTGQEGARRFVDIGGGRSLLSIALRKEDALLGVLSVYRQEVRQFSEKQIALLQNFAAQAVIAMENARLITDTREALEQQTATAEVSQVINSSPGDLAPVFDAMLDKATLLSEAAFGVLWTYDGELFHAMAFRNVPPAFAEFLRAPQKASPVTALGRIARGEPLAHIPDIAADEYYRLGGSLAQQGLALAGFRTILAVSMRKQGILLGAFTIYRQEVRPFSEKQVALLQNFAAQAVIAMENARLITEQREALDQQTATAEVLQVINSSPGELAPVFDAMLEKATRLCEAAFGTLLTFDGEALHVVALRNVPKELAEYVTRGPLKPDPNSLLGRSVLERRTIHTADNAAEDPYRTRAPLAVAAVELGGIRTVLHVPLIKDSEVLGVFIIFRQEVRPFSDKQIALLQNFAAQAVIAMENARLITETREALEQQTATAEILQVINSSPGNLAPVFATVLEKGVRLCEANFGVLLTYDGECFDTAALHDVPPLDAEFMTRNPPQPGPQSAMGRILGGERVVCIEDVTKDAAFYSGDARRRAIVELGRARSYVAVGLFKDDKLLGTLAAYRQEVRPFSEKEIALLEGFAAQAVIAMENARLLGEIRERQAELRVTFDNMGDGVVMFDAELRLAAWNRNFQQILDLPDALLAERPSYADYIQILAERGEFGTDDIGAELNRRLGETDQELHIERTRPNGRVIEVRRNSVPNGGFVLIYSDITERKRSEAEIRAARDAAEAAYRDLKAAQANLIQAEKMASLGQLTAGIAHEIKNPLNFVNNFAELSVELLDELKEAAAPAVAVLDDHRRAEIDEVVGMLTGNLEKIADHGRRADGIVKSMLEHSRGSSGERRRVDLNSVIEEALNLAYHGARAQDQSFNITLERDFGQGVTPIELVPQDITRVCLNLIGNGLYAATKRRKEGCDPRFQPTLKVTTRDLGDAVEMRVHDNGTGIAPEIRDKLFQPFFTTKPTGEGTGLGLSISYDIVTQQHGGTIIVDSQVGEFTEFIVRLPRAYGATMAEAAS